MKDFPKVNLKATCDTFLKLAPIDSQFLVDTAKVRIDRGIELTAIRINNDDHHYFFEFERIIENHRRWYAFIGHWEINDANPEADPVVTFNQKPRDRGPMIQVPGISNEVYLNDPISSASPNFFWYEATHGGTRLPTNANHTQNIIKIANAAQRVRSRISRPFKITSWYRPEPFNRNAGGARNSVHLSGGAIDFLIDGMSGRQMAVAVGDWSGGMGIYRRFPNLLHIDVGGRRRWGGA